MEQRPVERLWLFRYWFALHALRRGVNSLISDLDVVIHGGAPGLLRAAAHAPGPRTSLQRWGGGFLKMRTQDLAARDAPKSLKLTCLPPADFYAEFKAPPLDSLQFFQMPGSLWPNGARARRRRMRARLRLRVALQHVPLF